MCAHFVFHFFVLLDSSAIECVRAFEKCIVFLGAALPNLTKSTFKDVRSHDDIRRQPKHHRYRNLTKVEISRIKPKLVENVHLYDPSNLKGRMIINTI